MVSGLFVPWTILTFGGTFTGWAVKLSLVVYRCSGKYSEAPWKLPVLIAKSCAYFNSFVKVSCIQHLLTHKRLISFYQDVGLKYGRANHVVCDTACHMSHATKTATPQLNSSLLHSVNRFYALALYPTVRWRSRLFNDLIRYSVWRIQKC